MPLTPSIGNQPLQGVASYNQTSQQKNRLASKTAPTQNVAEQGTIPGSVVNISEQSRSANSPSRELLKKVTERPAISDQQTTQTYQNTNNTSNTQIARSESSVRRTINKFV